MLVAGLALALIAVAFAPALAQPAFSPGQILVRLRAGAAKPAAGALGDLARTWGVRSAEPLFPARVGRAKPAGAGRFDRVYRLRLAPGADPRDAAAAYAAHPDVVYAHPNYLYRPLEAPDDPRYADQANLAVIRWQGLWEGLGPKRREAVVAIIDSGVDYTHEDLADNIWVNAAEAGGLPGVDDDGNGYVDDIRGWDFADLPGLPGRGDHLDRDSDPMDESGHGTHVAGIVGAAIGNGLGIAGIADCRLMALRAGATLQSGGTFLEEDDLAAAILYAVDNGAHIVNMSWGSPERSFLIQDAMRYAADSGIILVAAAGNSGEEGLVYPAASDATIAVSATDRNDRIAGFSSSGATLDLSAPGVNVASTLPGNAYAARSGTSFAAPHVSGLAALLLSRLPGLTPEGVRSRLAGATADLGAPGWDAVFGAGRIDALSLLPALSDPDDPPIVRIDAPGTDDASGTAFDVAARAFGGGLTAYRLSCGVGRSPASWTPLLDGAPTDDIRLRWDVSALPDTAVVLRLEAEGAGGRVLEDRVLVSVRRVPPSIFDISARPILEGPRTRYRIRWTTDQPAEGAVLFQVEGAAGEDTLLSALVDRTQKLLLPEGLPAGVLRYRILSRGPSGRTAVTEPETLSISPFRTPGDGYTEVAALPDGFLADRPVDFDGDGRQEVVLMTYVEGRPFSPVQILERQDDGTFVQAFETAAEFLPWSIGDVTHDGAPDLLGAGVARVHIFAGFPFPSRQIFDQTGTWGGEIADLDRDGRNEILARSAGEPGIQVLKQGEDGAIGEVEFIRDVTPGPGDIGPRFVIADFDGDGDNGVLMGDADGDLSIHETGEQQCLCSPSWVQVGDDDTDARWVGGGADLDGDGAIEFAVARATVDDNDALNGHWDLEIYSATGPDAYRMEWTFRISGVVTTGNGIATGDLDGDGSPDLAVCLLPDLYIFRSDGPDAYRPVWHARAGLTHRPLIADLDGDGSPEILFNRDGAVRIFERSAPPADDIAPQILRARPLGSDRVQLTWTETPGAVAYRLFRGLESDTLGIFADGLIRAAYLDTGLVEGRVYRYAVAARLPDGKTVRSADESARPNRAPRFLRLQVLEAGRLALTFDEPMGPESDAPGGYTVTPGVGHPTSAIRDREGRRIVLTFPRTISSDRTYTLAISAAADTSGVPLPAGSRTVAFTPDRPVAPSAHMADFDGSGRVDFPDFLRFARAFGTADPEFDLDGDGPVGFSDFLLFAALYGRTA